MTFGNYTDKRFIKIMLYKRYNNPDGIVVYFRAELPQRLLEKYMWYFDYLAAILKIKYPKKQVKVAFGTQDLSFGEEYIQKKIKNLIIGKKSALKRMENTLKYSLFCDESEACKMLKLKQDICDLEQGIVNFYVPDEYINLIKQILYENK